MLKGYIQESISPYAVRMLVALIKDNTWHMCIDCRVMQPYYSIVSPTFN
jgi:hypothetical protein